MTRTAAIMQPTYLPWMGYFDMIDRADVFVFLDTVDFNSGSWQQRNRVKGPHGPIWLTVPTISTGTSQPIAEVEIDTDQGFVEDHLKTLERSYANAGHYDDASPGLSEVLQKGHAHLSALNSDLIAWLTDHLAIEAEFAWASDLDVSGQKVELLIDVCETVDADRYLSAQGSRKYIEANNIFPDHGIDLTYHDFDHPTYDQRFGEFISHLSVVDLLFNEGPRSLEIIRSGRDS